MEEFQASLKAHACALKVIALFLQQGMHVKDIRVCIKNIVENVSSNVPNIQTFKRLDKCFKSRASFSRTDVFIGFGTSRLRVACFVFSITAFFNCFAL
jgi:hypothetical protein